MDNAKYLKDPQVTWSPGLSCGLCFFTERQSPVHKILLQQLWFQQQSLNSKMTHCLLWPTLDMNLALLIDIQKLQRSHKLWIQEEKNRMHHLSGEWQGSATHSVVGRLEQASEPFPGRALRLAWNHPSWLVFIMSLQVLIIYHFHFESTTSYIKKRQ